MEKKYNTKVVFHIPTMYHSDGEIHILDTSAFWKRLESDLQGVGVESWYNTNSIGYYKGRSYKQVLMTLFCNENDMDVITAVYRRAIVENNDYLRQDAFAYECNGILHVVDL